MYPLRRPQYETVESEVLVSLEDIFWGIPQTVTRPIQVLNDDGITTRIVEKTFEFDITPGWKDGTKITFPEAADQTSYMEPKDMVFILRDEPHPTFLRDGYDITYTHSMTLKQALFCEEATITVPTIEGEQVPVTLPGVVQPGTVTLLPGHGLPIPKTPGSRGDLVVVVDVKFPSSLSHRKKHTLRKHLPDEGHHSEEESDGDSQSLAGRAYNTVMNLVS